MGKAGSAWHELRQNSLSRPAVRLPAAQAKQNDQQYSWQKGERPDPKDYMYVGLKGEVKIREPG